MPPQAKITRQMLLNAVLEITRESGFEAVNARRIAARLGCSTRPIFTCYETMDQLKDDFLEFAFSVYTQYAEAYGRREGLAPALVFPLSYLAFAREETRLFQFLFVRDMALDMARPADFYKEPGNVERARAFARQVGVDPEPGKELFLDLFLYTHGMAVLTASGKMDLPAASARAMVQRLLDALVRFAKEKAS